MMTVQIFCFRKRHPVTLEFECRSCRVRRRCRLYQLWLEPELPFVWKPRGERDSVFDLQNSICETLDALFPVEYRLLRTRALKALSGEAAVSEALVRLKMYDMLRGV
jgi:hypothetical protein